MKRAISLLLMVVMVLAPCAVAHAASLSGHHGSPAAASEAAPSEDMHAAPSGSHDQHGVCAASGHQPGDDTCSGNCEVLQRATDASAGERVATDLKSSYAALAFVLSFVHVISTSDTDNGTDFGAAESNFDSKTVLRKTARLRL